MSSPPTPTGMPASQLAELELFASLRPEQLQRLAPCATNRATETGQTLFEEDCEGQDFLVVTAGSLEARRETPVGTQTVAVLGPGEVVGEISLLDGKPRSSTVVGRDPGRVAVFSGVAVSRVVAEDPELEVALLRIFCRSLADKIRQANQVMTDIMAPTSTSERSASGTRGRRNGMDDESKRQLLRDQGMFGEDLQRLSAYLEAESFRPGDSIFVEGEEGDTLYLVAEGKVRISRHIPGMGEEALAILDRGEVFGEMAWIDSSPRSADAVAHTGGCTVLGISRSHLDGTLRGHAASRAQFLKLICQILCRRIRNMNDQLVAYRTMAFF